MKHKLFFLSALMILFTVSSYASEISPTGWGKDFETAMSLGDSYLSVGEYARALDEYEIAEKSAPHAAQASYKLALTLYRWGSDIESRRDDLWPLAMKKADRTIFLDPSYADANFLAALIRYRMGDFQSALSVYKEFETLRQGDADLYLDLAVAAWKSGDITLASNALERARKLNPNSIRIHLLARDILSGGQLQ